MCRRRCWRSIGVGVGLIEGFIYLNYVLVLIFLRPELLMRCRSEGFTAVKREFEDKRAVHISDRHPLLGHIRVAGASLPCV